MNYEGGSYAAKPQLRSYDVGSTSHITPSSSPIGEKHRNSPSYIKHQNPRL